MRKALLIAVTTAAGLGACAPIPSSEYGYGYTAAPQPAYGYSDGGYAPQPVYGQPYYAEPAYAAPYVTPGPAIIIGGGERRFNDRDRYRYNERRYDGGYRGNQNPGREYGRQPGPQNFGGGGGRPGPAPVAVNRPPPPQPQAPRPAGPPPNFGGGGNPSGHSPSFNPANPTAQGDRQ